MNSRYFTVLLAMLAILALAVFTSGCATPEEPAATERAAETEAPPPEAEKIYTKDDPGAWEGKESGHVPQITYEKTATGLTVKVVVPHVMDATAPHYIEWVKLMDGDGNVLGQAEFQPTDGKAEATFELTSVPAKLVAHEKCNIHGIWMAEIPVT